MTESNKLVKASFMYFIGNIFDKALAFLTIPVFTRLLDASDYGIASTYLSWISILSVIITLSLGNSIRTAIYDFCDDINGYISSIFVLGTISGVLVSACVILLFNFIDIDIPSKLIPLCCIHSYSLSIISSIQMRYLMEVKYIKRTLLQCIPNLIIVLLSIYLISNTNENKYLGRVLPYAYVYIPISFAFVFYYFKKRGAVVNLDYWKYAIGFSLPLIFHSLSNVILSQADRSMITWLRNPSETGIYSLAYQFGLVPLVISATLENVWIPWFSEQMQLKGYTSINRAAKYYILIMFMLCLVMMLISPEILKLMSTPEYFNAVYQISPIVAATFVMFLASLSINLEYYLKKTRWIALNTLVAAVINIILNFIFIPKYGAVAAAYTTLISYFMSFAIHYTYTKKILPELFPASILTIPIIIIVLLAYLMSFFVNYITVRWLVAFAFIIYSFLVFEKVRNLTKRH